MECTLTSPVRTECGIFVMCCVQCAVFYIRPSCFVVRGWGVSRRYLAVCKCDMFSVVDEHLEHLKVLCCVY